MADPTLTNVFEDPSSIRREGGFLRRITQLQIVHESGRVPDGYGVAWAVYDRAEFICAPMPWHLLFGWGYRTYWWLRTGFGGRAAGVIEKAILRGMTSERAQAKMREDFFEREHKAELERTRIEAYQRGARDQMNALLKLADGYFGPLKSEIDAAEKNH